MIDRTRFSDDMNVPTYKTVTVIGIGATGSILLPFLVKLFPLKKVVVYEYDEVESENIPNSIYTNEDIGLKKTEAIKKYTPELDKIEFNEKYTGQEINTEILILAVDNMKTRKKAVQNFNGELVIDPALGFDYQRIVVFNKKNKSKYLKEIWFPDNKAVESICTRRATPHGVLALVSRILNILYRVQYKKEVIEIEESIFTPEETIINK
jgi:hypothetical protein